MEGVEAGFRHAAIGQLHRPAKAAGDGVVTVETGAAPIVFLTSQALAARYAGIDLAGLPAEGPVTLAITVRDMAAAADCLRRAGIAAAQTPGGLAVAPAEAHGVILAFRAG